jgi:hypothetical protein
MLRAIVLFLGLSLCAPLALADDAPRKPGLMDLEDHKAFFRPGKYLSYDPDYDEYTRSTYSRVEFATEEGITTSRWRSSSVSTMPAVRPGEEGMFLKLRARNLTDVGIWDDRTGAFHYDNTLEELYPDIEAFLSSDAELQINPEDVAVGSVDDYFDDAVEQTDGECCLDDDQYQEAFLGPSTTRCAWLPEDHEWDVICNYRYINSGERRRAYIRREVDAIM